MTKATSVCGWSRGLGRGGSRTRGGEPGQGLVTQRTVWPPGVVIVSPRSCERPGLPDAIQDLHRQELISQTTVEALGVAVLPRATRFDVPGIDTHLPKPPAEGMGNELRTVIATNVLGTPRIAKSSESVSITSSLVMPRLTFKARRSRVYSSTIDSHISWLPLAVRS